MPVFKARYKGVCKKCEQAVEPGQFVSWSRRERGVVYHAKCLGYDESTQEGSQRDEQTTGEHVPTDRELDPRHGPTASDMDEMRVRRIAREEAQACDVENLDTVLKAVDKRMRTGLVTKLTVVIRTDESTQERTAEAAHHMLKRLTYLASKRRHAYLYGPPGSGKSTGAVQVAKLLGMRYGYVSLNPQTPESRLLGFIDAGGTYRETEFFRCYTAGGVFCIDELDNGHPALLNTLNGMLETDADGIGRGAFPCGVVERHPDFVCVATGNTAGRGADKLFPERRALDSAFLERFTFLAWEYDEALEQDITLKINKDAGLAWLLWVRKVRAYVREQGIRLWASPRASFNGAAMLKDSAWAPRDIADAVLFKGLDNDTVNRIVRDCPLPEVKAVEESN